MAPNIDSYHRKITYLRVSVTDRCNLRCIYCMPARDFRPLPHHDILRFEEILALIDAAIGVGIKKIRFTGGEPLVRKGFVELARAVCRLPNLEDVTLTTNGVLLRAWARPLYEAGIRRINVSLDTLNPLKFVKITGRDYFSQVWEGIEEAEAVGFSPIKINVVAMKGINDDELVGFAALSRRKPYQIRFIEYMPVGGNDRWRAEQCVFTDTIKDILATQDPLLKVASSTMAGPAERYRYADAQGEVGLISPMSHHFCPSCNRLRLTSDGRLRPCLFSDEEVDLKTALRKGADSAELEQLFRKAIAKKPKQHRSLLLGGERCLRPMSAIGG